MATQLSDNVPVQTNFDRINTAINELNQALTDINTVESGLTAEAITRAAADTALQNAMALKADLVGGKVPSAQLPSYVNDVEEYDNLAAFPVTGETDKLYIAKDTGFQYRWSGSIYVEIKDSGETVTSFGALLNSSTDKATPINADYFGIWDSVTGLLKKVSLATLKTTLLAAWKDATGGLVGMTLFKINFKNAANTFTSFLTNSNTAARTYTFPDKDMIVAGLDDIASSGGGDMLKTENLSGLANYSTARSNLGLGNVDNTADANKPVSALQAAGDLAAENAAKTYADGLITVLKDGVASPGDTLQKLYNLILGLESGDAVADTTARNAYNIPYLPFTLFVIDDGDGKWAKYQATTTGVGATFVKLSDPDLLNAVMSNAAVKIAYESNADTNAFTNALLAKLNAIEALADVTDAGNVGAAINGVADKATPVNADKITIWDTVANALKTVTFTNLKAFLKSYFDGIYQAILVSGTNIKTIDGVSILGAGNITTGGGGGGSGGREVITASLSANQNDYTITGMSTSAGVLTILELTLTASIKITGLNKTISAVDVEDGKVVRIFNTSSVFGDGYIVILERGHSGSGSSAANRLYNPCYNGMPPILQPNAYIDYQYSTTIGAWIYLGSSEWGGPHEFFDLYSDFISGPAPFLAQTGTGSHDSVDQRHLNTTIQQTVGTIGVTTTSSTSRYHIGTQNASIFPGFNSILGMLRVCPNALSDATDEYIGYFGFHDTFFSSTPVDAACWVYDRLSSTDWRILTGKASTLSYTTVTGFTPSISEYHYLGIFINGDATRVDFFYSVDGESWVFAGSKTGSSVPNTSSNTFGFAFGMNRSAGAGSKKVYCDWMGYRLSMKRGA